jgi:hypothetical protein
MARETNCADRCQGYALDVTQQGSVFSYLGVTVMAIFPSASSNSNAA